MSTVEGVGSDDFEPCPAITVSVFDRTSGSAITTLSQLIPRLGDSVQRFDVGRIPDRLIWSGR